MTTTIERRRPLPNLPYELWEQVFFNFSIVDEATRSDADTWANVTNVDDSSLHRVDLDFIRELVTQNVRTKISLSNVSTLFRAISRPILFELIEIRTYDGLLAFGRNVRESGAFADYVAQHTLRLDIIIQSPDSSIETNGKKELDIEAIFRACPRLKFVTWFVDGLPDIASVLFHALPKICPNVEALFWKSDVALQLSTLDFFTSLRIFHFNSNNTQAVIHSDAILPHLHTLSGADALFGPFARAACMPGLTTLIITESDRITDQLPFYVPFCVIHRKKIRNAQFAVQSPLLRIFGRRCPNITNLVLQLGCVGEVDIFDWLQMKNIGVYPDPAISSEQPSRFLQFFQILPLLKHNAVQELHGVRILHEELFQQIRSAAKLTLQYKALQNCSVIWESTSWMKGPSNSRPSEVNPSHLLSEDSC